MFSSSDHKKNASSHSLPNITDKQSLLNFNIDHSYAKSINTRHQVHNHQEFPRKDQLNSMATEIHNHQESSFKDQPNLIDLKTNDLQDSLWEEQSNSMDLDNDLQDNSVCSYIMTNCLKCIVGNFIVKTNSCEYKLDKKYWCSECQTRKKKAGISLYEPELFNLDNGYINIDLSRTEKLVSREGEDGSLKKYQYLEKNEKSKTSEATNSYTPSKVETERQKKSQNPSQCSRDTLPSAESSYKSTNETASQLKSYEELPQDDILNYIPQKKYPKLKEKSGIDRSLQYSSNEYRRLRIDDSVPKIRQIEKRKRRVKSTHSDLVKALNKINSTNKSQLGLTHIEIQKMFKYLSTQFKK